jgi:hypothetical protein
MKSDLKNQLFPPVKLSIGKKMFFRKLYKKIYTQFLNINLIRNILDVNDHDIKYDLKSK